MKDNNLYHPVYANGQKVAIGDKILYECEEENLFEICTVIDIFMGIQNSPSNDILLESERDLVIFSYRALDVEYIITKIDS